jgi:hypothetical protein
MSKIVDNVDSKMDISQNSTQSGNKKSNKNLFVVVFVALIVNLVLTISLAGAFVSLNENSAKADDLSALQAQTEEHQAIIQEARDVTEEIIANEDTGESVSSTSMVPPSDEK